jgi:N-methylhydantoinase A/oxoprolinase/acetone carboxylase beta subunit
MVGKIQPHHFPAIFGPHGDQPLDAAIVAQKFAVLAAEIGKAQGKAAPDPRAVAEGFLRVAVANMANAIRSRTVQKGIDPRGYALVAFGGAGPLHAVEVAQTLGIKEVIIPPAPGITSAMGLLTTDLKYDAVRTCFQFSNAPDLKRMTQDFTAMEAEIAWREGSAFGAQFLRPMHRSVFEMLADRYG